MDIKTLIKAARLRTLPLSVSGIVMGSALAYREGAFRWGIFVLALLTTVLFQVLSNFANDYGDGIRGTDNADRLGPERALQSGKITPGEMRQVIGVTVLLSIVSAVSLIYVSFGSDQWLYFLIFFVLGLLCVGAAIKYTVGKGAYGYMGLGDVFVFIYFGLVATLGTLFTQTNQLTLTGWVGAVAVGLISCALLMANNVRDIPTDSESGKLTLAVRLGDRAARITYAVEMILAILLCAVLVPQNPWFALIFVLVGPTVYSCVTVLSGRTGKDLIPVLKQAGIVALAYSLLMGLAVFLGNFNSLS